MSKGKIVNIHECENSGWYSLGILLGQLLIVFGSNSNNDLKIVWIHDKDPGQSFRLENGTKVEVIGEIDLPEKVRLRAFLANTQFEELEDLCKKLVNHVYESDLVPRVISRNHSHHMD